MRRRAGDLKPAFRRHSIRPHRRDRNGSSRDATREAIVGDGAAIEASENRAIGMIPRAPAVAESASRLFARAGETARRAPVSRQNPEHRREGLFAKIHRARLRRDYLSGKVSESKTDPCAPPLAYHDSVVHQQPGNR